MPGELVNETSAAILRLRHGVTIERGAIWQGPLMATLKQIVVDSRHPAALARFWALLLDDFEIRPYDDAEIARLAELGLTPETDPGVILDGPCVEICFQRAETQPAAKRPVHLDVRADDREAEVRRLVELGASIEEAFDSHTWMRDPEGNDFCVVDI